MTESNRNDRFHRVFNIKKDRPLFPENIGDNVVFNAQSDLTKFMKADENMLQKYEKVLNPTWQKADGVCRYLCAYIALHDLLVNKKSFSEIFLNDYYNDKEIDDQAKQSLELLANNLINQVENGDVDPLNRKELKMMTDRLEKILEIMNIKIASQELYDKILSYLEQSKSRTSKELEISSKNQETLTEKHLRLAEINKDDYVTLCFHSTTKRYGHATLMRKNGDDDFSFYDPNLGAVFGLTEAQLCKTVTQVFYSYTRPETNVLNLSICIFTVVALPALAIATVITAFYCYNTIAAILLIACIIDAVVFCYLSKHLELERPSYDILSSITSSDKEHHKNEVLKMSEELDNMLEELEECPDKQNNGLKEVRVENQQVMAV